MRKGKKAKLVVQGNTRDPIVDVQEVKPGTAKKLLRHTSLTKETHVLPGSLQRHLRERAPHFLAKK